MAKSLKFSEFAYGSDHELQKVSVWEVPPSPAGAGAAKDETVDKKQVKYWFIFIHGGAWRDPRITGLSVEPTIDRMLAADDDDGGSGGSTGSHIPRARIAGIASVDYRLTAHPNFPQDPASTPARQLRTARHPDHVRDVAAALTFLQDRFGFGTRYVLFGHSCGATMAFQLLMGPGILHPLTGSAPGSGTEAPLPVDALPAAIVGFEGLYDLRAINDRMGGVYRPYFAAPFGDDDAAWDAISPGKFSGSFRANWGDAAGAGKVAVLAHSPEDELVDMAEMEGMARKLKVDGVRLLTFSDLGGTHDKVWREGREVARVLGRVLEELDGLGEVTI